jgi:hypothetical protein
MNEGKLNVGSKDVCEVVVGIFQEQYRFSLIYTKHF